MQTITLTDINHLCTTILARAPEELKNGNNQYKFLRMKYNILTGKTTFIVEAQFQPYGVNSWRTVNKSYTILETAIIKYNELQF